MTTASFRWMVFLGGLAISVLLTILLWPVGVIGFLALPFIWIGRKSDKAIAALSCPDCGWSSTDSDARYCPRHGRALEP